MSTRARVGMVRSNGTILSIYTHSDGYISHHGPLLLEHYDTAQKVLALMKMGDCSQLCETIEGSFFYKRDRSELGAGARSNKNQALYFWSAPQCNAEYVYLFTPHTDRWLVAEVSRTDTVPLWQDLRTATVTERLTT